MLQFFGKAVNEYIAEEGRIIEPNGQIKPFYMSTSPKFAGLGQFMGTFFNGEVRRNELEANCSIKMSGQGAKRKLHLQGETVNGIKKSKIDIKKVPWDRLLEDDWCPAKGRSEKVSSTGAAAEEDIITATSECSVPTQPPTPISSVRKSSTFAKSGRSIVCIKTLHHQYIMP